MLRCRGDIASDHVGFPVGPHDANVSAWASSSAGFIFEDQNNTKIDGAQSETLPSTVAEMLLNTILAIPPFGESEARPETRYYCNVDGCNVSTTRSSDLERHMRSHSTGPRTCQFCLKEICNRPDKFKSHLEKYHKFDSTVLRDRRDLWEQGGMKVWESL